MKESEVRSLLHAYKNGHADEDDVIRQFRKLPFEDMGFADLDHHRELRQGFPEVVYAEGKTKEQVGSILSSLYHNSKGNLIKNLKKYAGPAAGSSRPHKSTCLLMEKLI